MKYEVTGWDGPTAEEWAQGVPELWTKQNRQTASALIKALLAARTADGWTASHGTYIHFQALAGSITDSPGQHAMRDVAQALKFVPHCNTCDQVTAMERSLSAWTNHAARERQAGSKTWLFALPAYVEPAIEKLPKSWQVQGVNLTLLSRENRSTAVPPLEGIQISVLPASDAPCFLVAAGSGAVFATAWEDAIAPQVEILRAGIEFAAGFFTTHLNFGGSLLGRRYLRLPEVGYVSDDGIKWEEHRLRERFPRVGDEPDTLPLTAKRLGFLDELANAVSANAQARGMGALIGDLLRLYGLAIDQVTHYTFLLHLWQFVERLVLSEDVGGRTGDVAKRFALVLKSADTGLEHALPVVQRVADLRNDIVHRGRHEVVDEMLPNVFGWLCQSSLLWLMRCRGDLPTEQHLRMFFRRGGIPQAEKELERAIDTFIGDAFESAETASPVTQPAPKTE